jgi:hypothetical protein
MDLSSMRPGVVVFFLPNNLSISEGLDPDDAGAAGM